MKAFLNCRWPKFHNRGTPVDFPNELKSWITPTGNPEIDAIPKFSFHFYALAAKFFIDGTPSPGLPPLQDPPCQELSSESLRILKCDWEPPIPSRRGSPRSRGFLPHARTGLYGTNFDRLSERALADYQVQLKFTPGPDSCFVPRFTEKNFAPTCARALNCRIPFLGLLTFLELFLPCPLFSLRSVDDGCKLRPP